MGEHHASSEDESDSTESDEEDTVLTVIEAKSTLRDIMTLCERQPRKRQLAEARRGAKGDPRAAMLTIVPLVVEAAEEALARRAKSKRRASNHASSTAGKHSPPPAASVPRVMLLTDFLRKAQFLVEGDSSGRMKNDMAALRALLSPP